MMNGKAPLFLGVDGGGSSCRARIEDEHGEVLGQGLSGPATTRLGTEAAWRSIMHCFEKAAAQAGLGHSDFARIHAGIGLAGMGRKGVEQALQQVSHPLASIRFVSDARVALLGAHSGRDGGIVIAGTGSVGLGQMQGREVRVGGYGFPISDEGSGASIGLMAVSEAMRAFDRRTHSTPLLAAVLEFFRNDASCATAWMEQATATDYAGLAPIVLQFARQGDPVARRLLQEAARGIGTLLTALTKQGVVRLSLVGGLADTLQTWLSVDLRSGLKPPDGDALSGALLVARGRDDSRGQVQRRASSL